MKLAKWGCVILFLSSACQKTDKEIGEILKDPTPYTLVYPATLAPPTVPADNPLTEEGVKLGRILFYEKKLSAKGNISCGSCHIQKFAFSSGTALSEGTDGLKGTRNTMHLANIAWDSNLTWDGSAKTLEEQARIPITNHLEMNTSLDQVAAKLQQTDAYPKLFMDAFKSPVVTPENIQKAIAQFERTLISSNSRLDRYLRNQATLTAEELEGMKLFMTTPVPEQGIRGGNCVTCHTGALSGHKFTNIGLEEHITDKGLGLVTGNITDNGKFKVPSLQNIALTAPYMHDGRFKTLEEVLDFYNEHVQVNSPNIDTIMLQTSNEVNGKTLKLTETEKAKIIKFLFTFTDSSFVNDTRYSPIDLE
ncbi:cytochrome-c peroxidase [Pontibacter silvestris]|uniref:Cytochrome-c peroxidase n=1 Tax=Pontibacter silvestris TaxID=2305183 RepID=A0ABW4X2M7_9BACT|nr:cytochrome c peroxidase [Pontibacter silvestris]